MAAREDNAKRELLLAEYREAMESQRSNTSIVYSWTGTIFLVLSAYLFIQGVGAADKKVFLPLMAFSILVILIWWGMTETFVFYIVQRMKRIARIETELGMRLMTDAGNEIKAMGWKARFREARTYMRLFSFLCVVLWLVVAWVKF